MRYHNSHENLKQKIITNPGLIGLEKISDYKEEMPYSNGKRKIGQVDIVFWDHIGRMYLVEITTGQSNKCKKRVKKQAKTAKNFFNNAIGISVCLEEGIISWEKI